jgi:secreted protein with Ig-like and vWFA domain
VRAPSFAETLVDKVPDVPTDAFEAVVEDARQRAESLLEEARERAEAIVDEARTRGGAAFEEAALRGGAAWDALRGERVGPPVAVARWPWAVAAALAGAAAGVAVAIAMRRISRPDAPDAQNPEDLEAVIDRP